MKYKVIKPYMEFVIILVFAPIIIVMFVLVCFIGFIAYRNELFFTQSRIGLNNIPFKLIKFRTLPVHREDSSIGFDESELTRYGRILRALSLDELPQFINFLKGEIALVGPRPLPVEYQTKIPPSASNRHSVKPGITGLTQIHGRNALSWPQRFAYDVEYVNEINLQLDLKITVLTIWQIVTFKNSGASSGEVLGNLGD